MLFHWKKTETRKRRSSPARLNKKRQPLIETCDWIFFLEIHFQRSRKVDFFLPQNREKIKQPVQVIRPFFFNEPLTSRGGAFVRHFYWPAKEEEKEGNTQQLGKKNSVVGHCVGSSLILRPIKTRQCRTHAVHCRVPSGAELLLFFSTRWTLRKSPLPSFTEFSFFAGPLSAFVTREVKENGEN